MPKKSVENGSIINFETLKSVANQNFMEEDIFNYDEELLDYLNDTSLDSNKDSQNHNLVVTIKISASDLSLDLSNVTAKSITLKIEV